jgi:hypothetical protein
VAPFWQKSFPEDEIFDRPTVSGIAAAASRQARSAAKKIRHHIATIPAAHRKESRRHMKKPPVPIDP